MGESHEKEKHQPGLAPGRRRLRAGHRTGKTELSEDRQSFAHGQLSWRDSRRPVSLARRRQLATDDAVGRRAEQAHLRLPGKDSLSRAAQRTTRKDLQLSEDRRSVQARRVLLLLQKRQAAESINDLPAEGLERPT